MALVLRETKGSALEWTELDGNFTHLVGLIGGKQNSSAALTAMAGVSTVADRILYATAPDVFAATPLTAFARSLLDDADAATARTTLGTIAAAEKGSANGLAPLGGDGKIASEYLPSTDAVTEGATNLYFTQARVRAATLLGLDTGAATAITATDTVLSALGKLQGRLNTLGTMSTQSASNVAITGGAVSGVSVSATSLGVSGDINITSLGRKITADLTSLPGRLVLQNSVANQGSIWSIVPNGTSNSAQTNAHNSPDWQNSTFSRSGVAGTEVFHTGCNNGSGAPCSAYRWGPSPTVNWTMNAAGVVTGADGAIKFGNYVSAPALVADGSDGLSGDVVISCRNNLGRVMLLQNNVNAKGVACNGPAGEWDGWLIYRPIGTNVAHLGVATPSAAGGGEAANAAFVRAVHASDRRIKSELEEVGPTLEKLRDITAYTYNQQGYDVRKLGTIAQDWQKHWPEATPDVTYNGEPRLSIDPLAAIAILTQALNELHDKVKRLEATQ